MPATNPFVPFTPGPLCDAELNLAFQNILNGTSFQDNVLDSRIVELNHTELDFQNFTINNPQAEVAVTTIPFTLLANSKIQISLFGIMANGGGSPIGDFRVRAYIDTIGTGENLEMTWRNLVNSSATFSSVRVFSGVGAGAHNLILTKDAFGTPGGTASCFIRADIIEL